MRAVWTINCCVILCLATLYSACLSAEVYRQNGEGSDYKPVQDSCLKDASSVTVFHNKHGRSVMDTGFHKSTEYGKSYSCDLPKR